MTFSKSPDPSFSGVQIKIGNIRILDKEIQNNGNIRYSREGCSHHGAGSGLGESTAKPHRAGLLKAMKIGTIARAGAELFLIGVAVSHLQGQRGVKIYM